MMKLLLKISVDEDGSVFFDTDYDFPEIAKRRPPVEWENGLYRELAYAIEHSGPNTRRAVKMLSTASTDPRTGYLGLHPKLEEALTAWRRAKAQKIHAPSYVILHQRVLLAIADEAPLTEEALLEVPGFGMGLLNRYGKEILEIVADTLPLEGQPLSH